MTWAPNPIWAKARDEDRLVRVDSLAKGTTFLCINGVTREFVRRGTPCGGYVVRDPVSGDNDWMCGCADVLVIDQQQETGT